MPEKLSIDGQRIIVTGAGGGIGRAHALLLGSRGASIIVNDFSREAADAVVAEIKDAGGSAVASYEAVGSKAAGKAMVETALDSFGGLEGVVNNAGFLRPALFEDMTEEQIDSVLGVHLLGTIYVTQAAWPVLQKQNYGRVVITGSSSGMFAHPGQINYCSAKAGSYGLMKALSYEGEAYGIKVNCLLPMAKTAISDTIIPNMAENYAKFVTPELRERITTLSDQTPDNIAHMAAYLISRDCNVSGEAFSVCRGRFGRVFVGVADGWLTRKGDDVSPEILRDHLAEIRDLSSHTVPKWLYNEVADVARRL